MPPRTKKNKKETITPEVQTTTPENQITNEESTYSSISTSTSNPNEESRLTCIITPEIKHNTDFTNELAYLARSDAHHDLG